MSVFYKDIEIRKTKVETVQVNLGNRCNQRCIHCHINASPEGDKNMDRDTAERVLRKILEIKPSMVEFTGGAPEMNQNLPMFIESLSANGIKTTVRTNLTILDLSDYSWLIEFFAENRTKLVASLPWPSSEKTDRQRGEGIFDKSIRVLRRLNEVGYGKSLELDLVHNPDDPCLPRPQEQLERLYKERLGSLYGIAFNKLITIINSPVGRFKRRLSGTDRLDDYMRLLVNNFNAETINHIMCRHLVSIDYMGYIYDCDFNLAIGIRTKGYEDVRFWEIDYDNFNPVISCGEHCYACTAATGSSCHGSLIEFNPVETVKNYYGSELKNSSDLKTGACCTTDPYPAYIKESLSYIADEILQRYYGCGSPIPVAIEGCTVFDIGCGTGRDCYVLSRLVGEMGFVYGIDMTREQIDIAIRYLDEQMRRFGYKTPNVRFIHDYIENIDRHIPENSVDIIISNCVVNLIGDKEGVLRKIHRVLKNEGEFYFSDIYADRRLPEELRTNPVLYGECLGGALYWKDFERLARKTGFNDPRIVSMRTVDIKDDGIKNLIGNVRFYSITYRLWKIDGLEDACEDYGHIAIYKGGIKESPFEFVLDDGHVFEKGRPERVCGNTALMLSKTRFKDYFEVIGSFERHFGPFAGCKTTHTDIEEDRGIKGCSCC